MTRHRAKYFRTARLAVALVALGLLAQVPAFGVASALAQQEAGGAGGGAANFLNPFPENDVWRGLVVGDSMAEGLLGGLLDAMSGEARLQLQKRHRFLASLQRDGDEEVKAIEDMVVKEKIHVVVVMLGMADRGGIRLSNGRRLAVGQGDWRTQYAARVDRIVRALRRRGVAVYWVGLPMMRRSDWNEDIEAINDVYRERALNNGGRYVDAYKESGDENGRFSDRGPDIAGKAVRLRDPEGYDFTPPGYRKLAFFIERQLKRDMATAREERAIPLAGSEVEQSRVNPEAGKLAALAAQEAALAKGTRDARAAASPVTRALAGAAAVAGADNQQNSDLRAENVRVSFKSMGAGGREEQVSIDIVRPALTQSVIALMTRRDKGDKPSQVGETVTDTLSNGLLVMRSVTPSRAGAERTGARPALTQQPFFVALAKGERLPSKPGRGDDFRWPREDDLPPPPTPVTAGQSAPIASPVPLAQPAKGRSNRNTRQQ